MSYVREATSVPGSVVVVPRVPTLPMKSNEPSVSAAAANLSDSLFGVMPRYASTCVTSAICFSIVKLVCVVPLVSREVCSLTLVTASAATAGVDASSVITVVVGAVLVETRSSLPLFAPVQFTRNHCPFCRVDQSSAPLVATLAVSVVVVKSTVEPVPDSPLVPKTVYALCSTEARKGSYSP